MAGAAQAGRAASNVSASPVLVLVSRGYAAGKAQLTSSRSFSAFSIPSSYAEFSARRSEAKLTTWLEVCLAAWSLARGEVGQRQAPDAHGTETRGAREGVGATRREQGRRVCEVYIDVRIDTLYIYLSLSHSN